MKFLVKMISVFVFLLISNFVFGWGKTGHRVVAEIAENNLTVKAKKQIMKITNSQSMVYWVNYPDFIKSDSELYKTTSSWHYLDFPENLNRNGFDLFLEKSSDQNLYKRTLIFINQLKNRRNLSNEEQIKALYFLTHLIGDAHQPLHLGREEDQGGNKIQLKWFGSNTNLHSLWDDKLVDFQKYSYTEYARILDYHTKDFNRNLTAGNLEDWLYDSYLQSGRIYSNVKQGDDLKYNYDYEHIDLLESQLLKAGLRLAKILNEIFD